MNSMRGSGGWCAAGVIAVVMYVLSIGPVGYLRVSLGRPPEWLRTTVDVAYLPVSAWVAYELPGARLIADYESRWVWKAQLSPLLHSPSPRP